MVRFKNRYHLLEIQFDPALSAAQIKAVRVGDVYHALMSAVSELHGESGLGRVKNALSVKVFNDETRIVVVRSGRDSFPLLASAVPFVRRFGKQGIPGSLRTITIGASIRSCERALIVYHRQNLLAKLPDASSSVEKRSILDAIDGLTSK